MLSDRSYMHRDDYPRRTTSAVVWIVSALVAAFVLELILLSPSLGSAGAVVMKFLPLSVEGLSHGYVWTLVTHGFLHSTGNPFHILFTILGIVFVGREIEAVVGSRRFLGIFAGALFVGGLGWAAVNWTHGGGHIGAGSAVFAFLVVLAGIHPHLEMTLLFFPVHFRIKHLVLALIVVDVLGLLFYEISGAPPPLGLTPSAHLGGMLAGWVYFRFLHAGNGWDRAPGWSLPAWLRWPKRRAGTKTSPSPSAKTTPHLRAEVDRILDKINSQGFGALTEEEKRILDRAKDLLSRP